MDFMVNCNKGIWNEVILWFNLRENEDYKERSNADFLLSPCATVIWRNNKALALLE